MIITNKICSSEAFEIELNAIKQMLIKKGYPSPLINRYLKIEIKRWNDIKPYGPEKCQVILVLSYAGKKSNQIKKKKKLTEKVYRAAKTTVIFTSSSVLSPKGKDLISNKHKSCVVYTFKCCCLSS